MTGAPALDSRIILAKSMRTVKCIDVGLDRDGECYVIVPANIKSEDYVNIVLDVVGEDASRSMQTLLEILDARAILREEMFSVEGQGIE